MKECNKCKVFKFLPMFGKSERCPDGHLGTCKECSSEYKRNWRLKKTGGKRNINTDLRSTPFKHCYFCKTIKPRDEFYKRHTAGDSLESSCKLCKDFLAAKYGKRTKRLEELPVEKQKERQAYQLTYQKENLEKLYEYRRQRNRLGSEVLNDEYLTKLVRASIKKVLPEVDFKNFDKTIILAAKRIQITLKRAKDEKH